MSHADPAVVARTLWTAIELHDWEAAADELAEDAVVDWPHSGERIRGRDNYLAINRQYPGTWRITIRSIVADRAGAAIELELVDGKARFLAACVYEMRHGRIARGTEYWVPADSQARPAWRAHLVEPLT